NPIPAPPLPDIPVPPAVKNWRVDPPTPAPTPAPHLLAAPVPEPPPPNPGVHAPGSPTTRVVTDPGSPGERESPGSPVPAPPLAAPVSRLPEPEPEPPAPAPARPDAIPPKAPP